MNEIWNGIINCQESERNFLSQGATTADHYENAAKESIKYWVGLDLEASYYLYQENLYSVTAIGDYNKKNRNIKMDWCI